MNVHVLLNLLNKMRKIDKMQGFATSLTSSIIQEHEC